MIGPPGVKKFHETVLEMYKEDIEYRTSLGFPKEGILDVNVIEMEEPGNVPAEGIPANITSASMIHNLPTYAYRFEIDDKIIVFSGDTSPTNKLVELARNADLLIHDCSLTTEKLETENSDEIGENLKKEHSTPTQAGETAFHANAKRLVLTHFLPNINVDEIKEEVREAYDGELILGKDLQAITI